MIRNVTTVMVAVAACVLLVNCGAERTPSFGNDVWTDTAVDGFSDVAADLGPPRPDEDGDTIADDDEGRNDVPGGVDTDYDGTPDYLDDDSDGDTIPDYMEGGDGDNRTPPRDADGDGTPDFRDLDSDGNGIFDAVEGIADTDGDGIHDASDRDNDGDTIDDIYEIGGDPSAPIDYDGDTIPDYMDLDSDNDTITDLQERPFDADIDGDLIPDRHDLDTDGDGIPDMDEAGDLDPTTWPVDTDGDGVADFRDADSDNDGLSDAWEHENGLNPYNEDSDGDTIPDLIEVGAGTDPNDPSSNPTTEGNFYFLVPFDDDPDPTQDTLVFATDIQMADVFVLMDTTGSMGGEISTLKSSLTSTIIPQVATIIPDVWFGVGRYDDYPYGGYGSGSDVVFQLLQRMTNDTGLAQAAVNTMVASGGSDGPESHVPAMYATATGAGFGGYLAAQTSCAPGEIGYPCFRPGAVPIILLITDAEFHNGPGGASPYSGVVPTPPTYVETVTALNAIHARVIGIYSEGGYGDFLAHCTAIATDTGAVDITGSPLVFPVSSAGAGMGSQVVDAINILASQVPMDISAVGRDDDTDVVDATVFINYIVPNVVGGIADPMDPTLVCVGGLTTGDSDADTVHDYFVDVLPGTAVCFDIVPARNMTVPATTEPQVFKAYVDVLGESITVLDTREVFFLIPPEFEGPGVPG